MDNLFDKWKTRIPNYSVEFKDTLFKPLSETGGAEGEKKISLGKHFSTNYELYTYAFFLGLYEDEYIPIPEGIKKDNFRHAIQNWGSKSSPIRKDFTNLQEYIFAALVAKTDLDFIVLDKGEITEDQAVKKLIQTMESYTNGGLTLIKEKLEDSPSYFLNPTSFLDMIVKTKKE
ncbi:hypothetical protein [Pontimicrobium sp. IMCC45349]|uniref:hypothetical protein n=1 Tax=Pontimicrobium sp. IMCC45349 TaxID=3391574 RepID=UPI00399F9994